MWLKQSVMQVDLETSVWVCGGRSEKQIFKTKQGKNGFKTFSSQNAGSHYKQLFSAFPST